MTKSTATNSTMTEPPTKSTKARASSIPSSKQTASSSSSGHITAKAAGDDIAIEAVRLSKQYMLGGETIHALDDVSLTVHTGDFVAVMGPSGSGKSTLLHLLGLLETPDAGEVYVAGTATAALDDDALTHMRRDKLGFIFQNFELIPNLSAEENITLPAEVAGNTNPEHLRVLAKTLNIADRLSHRPNQLSGGQQQRVAIARALINQPAVILADEPTGNLDSDTGTEVLTLLQRGVAEQGWTVVMVTHDPRAAAFANTLVLLQDGKIYQQMATDSPEAARWLAAARH